MSETEGPTRKRRKKSFQLLQNCRELTFRGRLHGFDEGVWNRDSLQAYVVVEVEGLKRHNFHLFLWASIQLQTLKWTGSKYAIYLGIKNMQLTGFICICLAKISCKLYTIQVYVSCVYCNSVETKMTGMCLAWGAKRYNILIELINGISINPSFIIIIHYY